MKQFRADRHPVLRSLVDVMVSNKRTYVIKGSLKGDYTPVTAVHVVGIYVGRFSQALAKVIEK